MTEKKMISITDWFGPHNLEHMKSYGILVDSGVWPEGFVPENVYYYSGWRCMLGFKLADAWMEYIFAQIPIGE